MLNRLSIKQIVLIESCEIVLEKGLCVLSGETGAGKSILLDALGLVLGARADAGLVRQGEAQGAVSAEFDISHNDAAKQQVQALELEPSDTLIIRRTLAADGKTRCLVNDQPVTVAALKKLGETLVEIHGQHDQRSLQDATVHRAMLDDYAGLAGKRRALSELYQHWREQMVAMESLKADIEQSLRERDYLQHMHKELKQLNPQEGEEESLAEQRSRMMQGEKLFAVINEATAELSSGKGALSALRGAQRTLTRSTLTAASQLFAPIIEGLEKAAIEAEEALYALEKAGRDATFDPNTLDAIEERLFALKAAGRKYNMAVAELPDLWRQVEEKLALVENQTQRLAALSRQESEAKQAFVQAAGALSEARRKAAGKLEKSIEAELAPLKMQGTRFRVRLEVLAEAQWSAWGTDSVHFECATNVAKGAKDMVFAPLDKIASGGELSRFMLAMKVALSTKRQSSTIIFDEIDTGTGGAVADAIGARLAQLGQSAQVLVVTHLPQVAARGSQHVQVSKQEKGKKITTDVKILSPKEREEELARMLAGAVVTPEARKAAQKLLEQAA